MSRSNGRCHLAHARAQQSKKVHRIAVAFPAGQVDAFTDTSDEPLIKAFFGELHRLGYFEEENLSIERYSGEGRATHQSQDGETTGFWRSGESG